MFVCLKYSLAVLYNVALFYLFRIYLHVLQYVCLTYSLAVLYNVEFFYLFARYNGSGWCVHPSGEHSHLHSLYPRKFSNRKTYLNVRCA